RGQNQIQADFGNTENFENSGHNSVITWNKVLSGGKSFNELKVSYYDSKRPRHPNSTIPEIVIVDTGTIGQRFFLPIDGNQDKLTTLEDFEAKQPFAFIQGFGFNGLHYKDAALSAERSYQTGYGLYAQDKWQVS